MKFNVDQFRFAERDFFFNLRHTDPKNHLNKTSELAAIMFVPVLALVIFLGERDGFTEPVTKSIENLKNFYGITELTGVRYEK